MAAVDSGSSQVDPPDCAEGSLRWNGWHQGCIFKIQLPLEAIAADATGHPNPERTLHGAWVLAAQDCELAWTSADNNIPTIEVRPLRTTDPPNFEGIRSRKFKLGDAGYLDSDDPRVMVSPTVLSIADGEGGHEHDMCPPSNRRRALKTWLGLRYDRPAVPEPFVLCHRQLGQLTRRPPEEANALRDILVEYSRGDDSTVLFRLVGVLPASPSNVSEDAKAKIEQWLWSLATNVPIEAGVAADVLVLTADRVSVQFLESSYAVQDALDVSWPRKGGGPIGSVA